jgi:hypothetical protein
MDSYRWNLASPARHGALAARLVLAALLALTVLAVGTAARPGRARAAISGPSGPQIVFVSPIYAGRNNGNAEGPVGANVSVQGTGWDNRAGPVTIQVVDAKNDAAAGGPGMACQNSGVPKINIPGLAPVPVDGSGNFAATSFLWPSAANTVGHSYWVCGVQQASGNTAPGVSSYTVLSAQPPALSVSATSVAIKGTVTVSGQNWVPGNQPITVSIVPCLACDAAYQQTQTVTAANDGTFSLPMTLPDAATAGTKLFVVASNQSSDPALPPALVVNAPPGAPQIAVVDQPTPTPTNTVVPTATNTPAPTRVPGGGTTTSNGSASGLLIVLLSALGVVLLLAALVAVLLFVRSRKPVAVAPGGLPYGGPGQYSGVRRTGGSGPTFDSTNANYYNAPPRGRRSGPPPYGQRGGWGSQQGWQQEPGPDDDDYGGDQPTVGANTPWR